jgi:hypothetical protein
VREIALDRCEQAAQASAEAVEEEAPRSVAALRIIGRDRGRHSLPVRVQHLCRAPDHAILCDNRN